MQIETAPRASPRRGIVTLTGLAAVLLLSSASAAPETALPAAPANGELGFILDGFAPAMHQGKNDCPDGLANTVRENYLDTLAPAERTRLLLKANEPALTAAWKASVSGPNNTNICANPELFARPVQKTFRGGVAPGLDLDGASDDTPAAGTCGHEAFVSPTGVKGIDNQAYRAMGCVRTYRGIDGSAGDVVRGFNNALATGEHAMVLRLRGVDSLIDDPEVEVMFATTEDRPVLDTKRNFIIGASFTVSKNPRWRNALRGRIVGGVLTTEPADIRLTQKLGHGGVRGAEAEYDFRAGRLQLAFQPDGSIRGLFGAYQPVRNVIQSTILGGIGAATVAGIDCASQLATLQKMADGLPDASGKCTAVSTAIEVTAVPAFVLDRPASVAAKD